MSRILEKKSWHCFAQRVLSDELVNILYSSTLIHPGQEKSCLHDKNPVIDKRIHCQVYIKSQSELSHLKFQLQRRGKWLNLINQTK